MLSSISLSLSLFFLILPSIDVIEFILVAVGASILLLVGVCIGIIVGASSKRSNKNESNAVSANSKAVAAVCASTDYRQQCIERVKPAAKSKTATLKEFIQAATKAIINMVEGAKNNSGFILDTKGAQKMAKEDCDESMNFAVEDLQASFSVACTDGVTQPELKNQTIGGLQNAPQLTSNALAIVSAISGILNTFHIPQNMAATSRRLLHAHKTALAAYPKNLNGRYITYVKAGSYDEYITVTRKQVNVFMYGDGPRKTIFTGRKNNRERISTYKTASFLVVGNGFIAKAIGFQNKACPEGHHAVALLDFIFGDSSTVIQNSLIIATKPMYNPKNTVTAHGLEDRRETTGLIIQNCRIVPEELLYPVRFKIPTYLGRPWKLYSRTIIMETTMGDFIQPAGWLEWQGNFPPDTLYHAEHANMGPRAATDKRVNWKGFDLMTNRNEAPLYAAGTFIQGNAWLKDTGGTYFLGLKN
ncbi:Pectinesterase [Citrus sinensis]|uniref:Pectinesterase n=1 Tax=Citrus sinensis TaxID=2711 RepID=A0ACB8IAF2_CITSI|nr:Pectinesterase [Citrus sinensis]